MGIKLDHQVEELTAAIRQTINIENTKARLDVLDIINDGLRDEHTPTKILLDIAEWARG